MKSFAIKCCDAMAGDAKHAERCPILKFTTENFVAVWAEIQKKISSRFAPDAMRQVMEHAPDKRCLFQRGSVTSDYVLPEKCTNLLGLGWQWVQ